MIIKAAGAPASAAPSGWDRPTPQADPELIRLRAQVGSLAAQVAKQDEAVARLEQAAAEAYAQGEAAGRTVAAATFEDREQDRLELLELGIAQAVADGRDALAGSERLAVLVARECLDRMLGAAAARAELVQDLIRHQYAQLDAQSILAVRVSPADFTELAALQPSIDLQRDDRLAAGEVRIDLALGTISAGIAQQWGAIRDVLSELAGAES